MVLGDLEPPHPDWVLGDGPALGGEVALVDETCFLGLVLQVSKVSEVEELVRWTQSWLHTFDAKSDVEAWLGAEGTDGLVDLSNKIAHWRA